MFKSLPLHNFYLHQEFPLRKYLELKTIYLTETMQIIYPEIGVCGLSCRLCPMYNTEAESRCLGCKSPNRIAVGCPFITCAVKKKGIEFCWDCEENKICEKWKKHREAGKKSDSFKCYQKLEEDIRFIQKNGIR
jgi:hypothetical protein